MLDSEFKTLLGRGTEFRVFGTVGGSIRLFEPALAERSTFGTWRSATMRGLTGDGFSTSLLRFKKEVAVETIDCIRETEVVVLLLAFEGIEALSVIVDFCRVFENEVKMSVQC